MAESAEDQTAKERTAMRVIPEDYVVDGKDHTAVKVICLGDSAVGKSK